MSGSFHFEENFCSFNGGYVFELEYLFGGEGNDGYFIDMDTVKIESATVFSVNLAIIRLDSNQMDLIDLQINHGAKNYVIRSTRTLSYDERTEIRADYTPRSPKSYSDKSYMGDIVQIVIYGGE